ncbi:Beta-barrel assembly machine subunit BamE [Pseudidiomarina planktonica]|uniref:Outer membrane protein assembly factor BamE n=1 Tax=Pseudidiomarina planktonica TaxID=1323738 RepID=A0A1Y6ELN2_9GAMM|nr:outer membrane protein assembly factor BamE [Pseudidiomarina planktonica]RUO65691.1 outer membrane protein assembly factor BamE [Pseudidiomarina planktonica]SMQ63487.1 Beta-barrel assembly machine subunit BamE [Pseudidiomarina planktonica]
MKAVILGAALLVLSGCSVFDNLVYRINVPQGNYLEQRDVDKLRIGMSKEQVQYVLGTPVAKNVFVEDTWHYLYHMNPGKGDIVRRELIIEFADGQLATLSGDYDTPENFDVPLDQ